MNSIPPAPAESKQRGVKISSLGCRSIPGIDAGWRCVTGTSSPLLQTGKGRKVPGAGVLRNLPANKLPTRMANGRALFHPLAGPPPEQAQSDVVEVPEEQRGEAVRARAPGYSNLAIFHS